MVTTINVLLFLVFFIFVLGVNFRIVRQVRSVRMKEANFLFLSFILAVDIFTISGFCLMFNLFPGSDWLKFCGASIGAICFLSFAFGTMAFMDEFTSKKLKTLVRLPIIGLLLGVYFKAEYLIALSLVVEGMILLFLFFKREKQLYIFRQQVKAFLCLVTFVFLIFKGLPVWALIAFMLFLLMKLQIMNSVKLKLTLS